MHSNRISSKLIEYRKNIQPRDLFPTTVEEAAVLIGKNPFAFIFAGSIDRGTKAEVIWTIPYHIKQEVGKFKPGFFAEKSRKEIREIFEELPNQPRYINAAPRTVKELSERIIEDFDGDTEKIWSDRSAKQVIDFLKSVHGVGPGISSMIVNLLNKCFDVKFDDLDEVDIKGDVQLAKVFRRLGLIDSEDPEKAIEKARELYPEYPGKLDASAWVIGREYCKRYNPDCDECPLDDVCEKNI